MTYLGALSRSSCQNAAIIPRVHATAPRRALVTSASCDRDRSRMTLDEASYSEKTLINSARNALRFFGGSVARCAFISAPIIVSSTDGDGISSTVDGGKPAYSGMVPPDFAPQGGRDFIQRRNSHSRNRRASTPGRAIVAHPIQPLRFSAGRAVGPGCGGGIPNRLASGRGQFSQRQTTGLRPAAPLPLPKALRQSAQLFRRSVRLSHSLPFQPHGSGLVLNGPDLASLAKVHPDHVAHLSILKSAPQRPVSVQQQ